MPIKTSELIGARDCHLDMLRKYRGKKKWELEVMEDEVDDEADGVYADLKNLQEEKQFYLYKGSLPDELQ